MRIELFVLGQQASEECLANGRHAGPHHVFLVTEGGRETLVEVCDTHAPHGFLLPEVRERIVAIVLEQWAKGPVSAPATVLATHTRQIDPADEPPEALIDQMSGEGLQWGTGGSRLLPQNNE